MLVPWSLWLLEPLGWNKSCQGNYKVNHLKASFPMNSVSLHFLIPDHEWRKELQYTGHLGPPQMICEIKCIKETLWLTKVFPIDIYLKNWCSDIIEIFIFSLLSFYILFHITYLSSLVWCWRGMAVCRTVEYLKETW